MDKMINSNITNQDSNWAQMKEEEEGEEEEGKKIQTFISSQSKI